MWAVGPGRRTSPYSGGLPNSSSVSGEFVHAETQNLKKHNINHVGHWGDGSNRLALGLETQRIVPYCYPQWGT